MAKKFRKNQEQEQTTRINHRIRVPQVRLIKDGVNMGVIDTYKAKAIAQEAGLDLVEVSPNAKPPVCSIMDYGKYRYEQQKKEKKKKETSSVVKIKEIKLSPAIGKGDLVTKANRARDFIEDGMKVQLTLRFKKRQNAHKDVGFEVIKDFMKELEDLATIEMAPKLEGNCIRCRIERKKEK